MSIQLLEIEPKELKFIFELKKQSTCTIPFVNITDHYVAFKVKTTNPRNYCVKPNIGVIKPKAIIDCTVWMQAKKIALPDLECKDKFLVQSTIVAETTTVEDFTSSMFVREGFNLIGETKLRVTLISPQLLEIQPKELTFMSTLKSSCTVRLTNITDSNIAFKVNTPITTKYFVRPTVGVIIPKSTCDCTVTLQDQQTSQPDLECKEKFLVQSMTISFPQRIVTDQDFTSCMFVKDDINYIEEKTLKVRVIISDSQKNETLKQSPVYKSYSILKDEAQHRDEIPSQQGVRETLLQVMKWSIVLIYMRSVDTISNRCVTLTLSLTSASVCPFKTDGDVELMEPK